MSLWLLGRPAVLGDLGRAQRLVAGMATRLARQAAEATADHGPPAAADMVGKAAREGSAPA